MTTATYRPLYEQCRRSHVRPTPVTTNTARELGDVICSILTKAKATR